MGIKNNNIIKATRYESTAIILKAINDSISSETRNKRRISIFAAIIQHSIGNPSYSNQIKKETNWIQIGKEEIKLSLFTDDVTICRKILESCKSSSMNFGKVQDTKLIYRNLFCLYTLIMSYHKEKSRNQSYLKSHQRE